jgi:hypothetical protein
MSQHAGSNVGGSVAREPERPRGRAGRPRGGAEGFRAEPLRPEDWPAVEPAL